MGSGGSSNRLAAETDEGRINRVTEEETEIINELFEERKFEKALEVQKIDTLRKENEVLHKTDEFERDDVTILRRGRKFDIKIIFDRQIEVQHDVVRLQLTFGDKPRENKGTLVRIPVNLSNSDTATDFGESWSVKRKNPEKDGKVLEISITSPPDALIGYYNVYIETKQTDDKKFSRTKSSKRIIMLFNPWCEDDTVFMENNAEREEYVMNDEGVIWKGSKNYNGPDPWNFGQFEQPVLSCALDILDRAQLTVEARNNPVIISRKISALVNVNDDMGIVWGRWTKTYPEGTTAPWDWIGSVAIIKQFVETGKPVKYGQCWVFSGVTTTLLRALGIPTRTITNFASAHDHDSSMTIDKFIDEDGKIIKNMGDSIWNFHVWNECWFKRFDLPEGYDGWQVVDATPQESSGGIMQCGPCPVRAVKEGHVYLNYDTMFVYAEVNGDEIYWKRYNDGRPDEFVRLNANIVGAKISTKAVGSDARHDLTNDYRYPNGSDEETHVRAFISRFSTKRLRHIYEDHIQEKEIEVDLQLPKNSLFGDDFSIHTRIQNTTNEERNVSVWITLLHCYYTGVSGERIKVEQFNVDVGPRKDISKTINIPFNEYKSIPNPEGRFQLYVTVTNEYTKRTNIKEDIIVLGKPEIEFQVPETVKFGTDTKAVVKFKNTTSITLTKCRFVLESIGVLDENVIRRPDPLAAGEEWSETIILKPYKRTKQTSMLVASFDSEELVGIVGSSDKFKVINRPSLSDA